VDIYQYIAFTDPYIAKSICSKFGMDTAQAQDEADMAECLRIVVAENGAEALSAIVDVHPDKDLILEMKAPKTASKDCGCKKSTKTTEAYIESAQSSQNGFLHQGNTFLFAGIIIVAVALIVSSNKSKS
jgi:hypothetical protein